MPKKQITLFAVLVVLIILFSGAKFRALPSSTNAPSQNISFVNLPESLKNIIQNQNNNEQGPSPTQNKPDSVRLPNGTTIKQPDAVNDQGDIFVAHSSGYQIIYLKQYAYFIIYISGKPYDQTRKEAENAFLAKVANNSKIKACSQNAVVVSPAFAYPDLAGQQDKLSFCK